MIDARESQIVGQDELAGLFRRALEMCGVVGGATIAILTEAGEQLEYAALFAAATGALDAKPLHLDLAGVRPRGADEIGARQQGEGLGSIPAALEALALSDLVVDLTFLLFTPELWHLQRRGTAVLTALTPADAIRRCFPDADLRRRAKISGALLADASALRVTSAAGTDLRYELGEFPPLLQYGVADEPGRWDYLGSGLAATNPNDGGADGHVALSPGDIVFPWNRQLRGRIDLDVRRGRIVSIDGGAEARDLADFIAKFDDDRAYAIAHVGWGLLRGAGWDPTSPLEPRGFLGRAMFSTGPNVEFGGNNDTPCHLDIPMRNCSIAVDGEQVTDDDRFVIADLEPSINPLRKPE